MEKGVEAGRFVASCAKARPIRDLLRLPHISQVLAVHILCEGARSSISVVRCSKEGVFSVVQVLLPALNIQVNVKL